MRTFEEMPSPFADMCEHAGVNKACRSCRKKYDEAARIALEGFAQWQEKQANAAGAHTEVWYEHRRAAKDAENYAEANHSEDAS